MKFLIIGAGFVGLTTACTLAEQGHKVFINDVDEKKMDAISTGQTYFYEPGLAELLNKVVVNGNLECYNWESSIDFDLTIICVGTPSQIDGSVEISYVSSAISVCNELLVENSLVAIKSTVLPGTARKLRQGLANPNIIIASMPEFLREGSALHDARNPDRMVIGASSKDTSEKIAKIMDFDPDKTIHTTNFSAESIKYVSNSFLATCISFTNEVFTSINSDPDFNYRDVLLGWHSDKRLNFDKHEPLPLKKYLIPGIGYGGSCFPKDVLAFNQYSQMGEGTTSVLRSVIEANKKITLQISDWIKECIPPSETVILLGLGFKENTDDMRESPSLKLWQELSYYFEN